MKRFQEKSLPKNPWQARWICSLLALAMVFDRMRGWT